MSEVERLAREVILCGLDGTELGAHERRDLETAPFAGHVLFARNGESAASVRALTDAVRACYERPPLIAIDQEGGRVARIRDGVEGLPSMRALGETGDLELAYAAGAQCAHDLRRAGCSVNFAPVLDLAVDPANTVIGTRAFGPDAERAFEAASAFARGLEDGGVVAVYKHFPGHGSTATDSHRDLPRIALDAATWRSRDALPFARVAPNARAMMAAHVVLEAFDDRAATTSRVLLHDVLRDDLGFRGVLFTDCLHMDAIGAREGTLAGALAALRAGADALLVSHSRELAYRIAAAIVQAVDAGTISYERLQSAHARVGALRDGLAPPVTLDDPAPHPGIGARIARRAVRALAGLAHADAAGTIVVTFSGAQYDGAGQRDDVRTLRAHVAALRELPVSLEPSDDEVDRVVEAIAHSGRRAMLLTRRAHLYGAQRRAVERLLARFPDAIVVSVQEPGDAELFAAEGKAKTVLATFGDDDVALAGFADAVFSRV